jgi:hypothetical protein
VTSLAIRFSIHAFSGCKPLRQRLKERAVPFSYRNGYLLEGGRMTSGRELGTRTHFVGGLVHRKPRRELIDRDLTRKMDFNAG